MEATKITNADLARKINNTYKELVATAVGDDEIHVTYYKPQHAYLSGRTVRKILRGDEGKTDFIIKPRPKNPKEIANAASLLAEAGYIPIGKLNFDRKIGRLAGISGRIFGIYIGPWPTGVYKKKSTETQPMQS